MILLKCRDRVIHVDLSALADVRCYPNNDRDSDLPVGRSAPRRTHAQQKSWLAAALAQAAVLLINHIAPRSRTLAPSA